MARRIHGKTITPVWFFVVFFCARSADLTPAPQISADSLRGHVSFLASDLLEGRATPSAGLDLAAEYIAAQFRRAGLEPAAGDSYFQTAPLVLREPDYEGFAITLTAGSRTLQIAAREAYVLPDAPLKLDNAPVIVAGANTQLTPEEVDGKVVILTGQRPARGIQQSRPALVLTTARELPSIPQVRNPEMG